MIMEHHIWLAGVQSTSSNAVFSFDLVFNWFMLSRSDNDGDVGGDGDDDSDHHHDNHNSKQLQQ